MLTHGSPASEIYATGALDGSDQTRLTNDESYESVRKRGPDWGPETPSDTTGPETTITSGPDGPTNDDTPTFDIDGCNDRTAEADLRFSYKVDDGDWSDYSADTSTTLGGEAGLSDGEYTFYVRAKDEAGNVDESPAEQCFTVDTVPPEVIINGGTSGTIDGNRATFYFYSNETDVSFGYSLDGGGFWGCSSPETYEHLSNGEHTFEVRATDRAGNTGPVVSSTLKVERPPVIFVPGFLASKIGCDREELWPGADLDPKFVDMRLQDDGETDVGGACNPPGPTGVLETVTVDRWYIPSSTQDIHGGTLRYLRDLFGSERTYVYS